jgi:hypothetical protein
MRAYPERTMHLTSVVAALLLLLGGVSGLLNLLYPIGIVLSVYNILFSLLILVTELKQFPVMKTLNKRVDVYFHLLSVPRGKAGFYVFVGVLAFFASEWSISRICILLVAIVGVRDGRTTRAFPPCWARYSSGPLRGVDRLVPVRRESNRRGRRVARGMNCGVEGGSRAGTVGSVAASAMWVEESEASARRWPSGSAPRHSLPAPPHRPRAPSSGITRPAGPSPRPHAPHAPSPWFPQAIQLVTACVYGRREEPPTTEPQSRLRGCDSAAVPSAPNPFTSFAMEVRLPFLSCIDRRPSSGKKEHRNLPPLAAAYLSTSIPLQITPPRWSRSPPS